MSVKTVLLTIYYSLKMGSRSTLVAVLAGPPLMVLIALTFSPKAAVVVLALEAGLLAAVVVAARRFMERFINSRLEPVLDYGEGVDRAAVERLGMLLENLGFRPAGLYRIDQVNLEVMVREDWKIYALIHCGGPGIKPYLEYGSIYEGDRFYQVSDANIKSEWFYPDSIVNDNFPGKNPDELLDIFMKKRPDQGLLETPPEKFPEYHETEMRLVRAQVLKSN